MSRKRLVVCCDGTWNEPGSRTNVWRLKNAVAPFDAFGREQWVYYDKGVGTDRGSRIRGGMFGVGLSENLQEAYRFLVKSYNDGDEIWCFGFSRGAYTARSLCGFIKCVGLMHHRDLNLVEDAYAYYRLTAEQREKSPFNAIMHDLVRYTDKVSIRMLGVFDTVGALGVPLPYLKWLGNTNVQFHDTALSDIIENAYQALAIDERRGPFQPTLWTLAPGRARRYDGREVTQHVVQVWFAGVHSDVGGGYDDKCLGNITLAWMLDAAEALGLGLRREYLDEELRPDCYGPLHDSYTRGWQVTNLLPGITKAGPRTVGNAQRHMRGEQELADIQSEMLHWSVMQRVQASPGQLPREQAPYRPINVVGVDGRLRADLASLRSERRHACRCCPADERCSLDGREAILLDLSSLGARLRLDDQAAAAAFPTTPGPSLTLRGTAVGERAARPVWQQNGEIGLTFV